MVKRLVLVILLVILIAAVILVAGRACSDLRRGSRAKRQAQLLRPPLRLPLLPRPRRLSQTSALPW